MTRVARRMETMTKVVRLGAGILFLVRRLEKN